MIHAFLEANRKLSRRLDVAARKLGRRDGNYAFVTLTIPSLLRPGLRVLDVGGGKNPAIPVDVKRRQALHVVGMDVSSRELSLAPEGAYDAVIVGDVAREPISGEFDLVLSCAVLEHVRGTARALENLASCLAPSGTMAHFVPCARAPFAVANRVLGVDRARKVLFSAMPSSKALQGFEAFYEDCWPSRFRELCEAQGLEVVSLVPHFASGYMSFFYPLHAADVARQLLLRAVGATDLCESFTIVARRP